MVLFQLVNSLRIIERVLCILAFIGLSVVFLGYTFGPLGLTADYETFIRVSFAINYILLIIAFSLVVMNKSRSSFLRTIVTAMTCITLLALTVSLFTAAQDALGVTCTNSLGAPTQCSANTSLMVSLVLLFPTIFEAIALIIGALFTTGLLHELWLHRKQSSLAK